LDENGNDAVPDSGGWIRNVVVRWHAAHDDYHRVGSLYLFEGLEFDSVCTVTVDPSALPEGVIQTVNTDGGNDNTLQVDWD